VLKSRVLRGSARAIGRQSLIAPLSAAEGFSMPTSFVNNSEHWRKRAAEARQLANSMSDPISRTMMLGIADDYDRLAARAEIRIDGKSQSK
jgi:hypothetical protein